MILGLIFSKDRAMQLDAVLHSFFLNCLDAEKNAVIRVIYKVSNEFHAQQYNELIQLYPQVLFVEQKNFRRDLIENIISSQNRPPKRFLYNLLSGIGSVGFPVESHADAIMRRFLDAPKIFLLKMLLPKIQPDAGVLLLVDDNIFVRRFYLSDITNALLKTPKAIGFSLRLGRNTQYCYPMRQPQALPDFELVSPDVLKYNWTDSELEFSYPLEISSSLYLAAVIVPILMATSFRSPNELETKVATRRFNFQNQYPELLCFDQSVTFCNPINMVQSVYQNRAGEQVDLSIDHLAELFAKGKRVNIHSFDGFIPNACHQEVELTFEDRP